jgi:hypothetical protein
VEYSVLPNFMHVDGVDNIAPYVDRYRSDFLGWTWNLSPISAPEEPGEGALGRLSL